MQQQHIDIYICRFEFYVNTVLQEQNIPFDTNLHASTSDDPLPWKAAGVVPSSVHRDDIGVVAQKMRAVSFSFPRWMEEPARSFVTAMEKCTDKLTKHRKLERRRTTLTNGPAKAGVWAG